VTQKNILAVSMILVSAFFPVTQHYFVRFDDFGFDDAIPVTQKWIGQFDDFSFDDFFP
jgi:hypothetical protein